MAFEMIEKYRLYICESGDTKKVTEIEEGSPLIETDTNLFYRFDGSSWVIENQCIKNMLDFNTVLGAGLNPKLTAGAGFTSNGISTTTENILTPLYNDINLSNIYYPPTAQKLWVVSTDAQDNPTGTGASLLGISGLDTNYNEITDVVQLNGITPVETNLDFIRANACFILGYGTGNVKINDERFPAGNLFVSGTSDLTGGLPDDPMIGVDGTNADDFLKETANREAIYTVPDNKIFIMKDYTCNTELSKTARLAIHVRLYGEDFFRMIPPQTLSEGVNKLSFDSIFALPPRTDIQGRVKNNTGTSNSFVYLNFVGHLYDIS